MGAAQNVLGLFLLRDVGDRRTKRNRLSGTVGNGEFGDQNMTHDPIAERAVAFPVDRRPLVDHLGILFADKIRCAATVAMNLVLGLADNLGH